MTTERWRLAAFFRPESIYVHLRAEGTGERTLRLSAVGLTPEDRQVLLGLVVGGLVPDRIVAALCRTERAPSDPPTEPEPVP